MDFYIKRGDDLPTLVIDLAYSDGSALDLTGATARFLMRRVYESDLVIDQEIDLDPVANTATWDWTSGGTDVVQHYRAEIEVTFSDGRVQTFPTVGTIGIHVVNDMGGSA